MQVKHGNPTRPLDDVCPLAFIVPVQFSINPRTKTHVHTGKLLGGRQLPDSRLSSPAALFKTHMRVCKGPGRDENGDYKYCCFFFSSSFFTPTISYLASCHCPFRAGRRCRAPAAFCPGWLGQEYHFQCSSRDEVEDWMLMLSAVLKEEGIKRHLHVLLFAWSSKFRQQIQNVPTPVVEHAVWITNHDCVCKLRTTHNHRRFQSMQR